VPSGNSSASWCTRGMSLSTCATINRFIADTNADPKPLVWTADPHRPRRCQTRETSVRVGPLDAAGTRARCSIRSASDSRLPAGPQARYKGKTKCRT
jgi:hypothetical protein